MVSLDDILKEQLGDKAIPISAPNVIPIKKVAEKPEEVKSLDSILTEQLGEKAVPVSPSTKLPIRTGIQPLDTISSFSSKISEPDKPRPTEIKASVGRIPLPDKSLYNIMKASEGKFEPAPGGIITEQGIPIALSVGASAVGTPAISTPAYIGLYSAIQALNRSQRLGQVLADINKIPDNKTRDSARKKAIAGSITSLYGNVSPKKDTLTNFVDFLGSPIGNVTAVYEADKLLTGASSIIPKTVKDKIGKIWGDIGYVLRGAPSDSVEKIVVPQITPEVDKSLSDIATKMVDLHNKKVSVKVIDRWASKELTKVTKELPSGYSVAKQMGTNATIPIENFEIQKQIGSIAGAPPSDSTLKESVLKSLRYQYTLPDNYIPAEIPKDISEASVLFNSLFRRGTEVLKDFKNSGVELLTKVKLKKEMEETLGNRLTGIALNSMKGMDEPTRLLVGKILNGTDAITKTTPNNVKYAVNKIRTVLDMTGDTAEKLSVTVRGEPGVSFSKIKGPYFPHVHDITQLEQQSNRLALAKQMVEEGKSKTVYEANKTIQDFVQQSRKGFSPFLELHRTAQEIPGWIEDPAIALPMYFKSTLSRLAEVAQFGPKNEKLAPLLDQISREIGPKSARMADQIIQQELHPFANVPDFNNVLKTARAFQTVTKMTLSAISNYGQKVNVVLSSSAPDLLYAVKNFNKPEAKEFAMKAGAIFRDMSEVVGEKVGAQSGEFASKYLDFVRFTSVEEKNRIFASVAGKNRANDLSSMLLKNPSDQKLLKEIGDYGLDPFSAQARALKGKSPLTPNDIRHIAREVSNKTQFSASPINLPLFWSSPQGKVLFQFKNFSYNQSIFLYDTIIKDGVLKGNALPFLKFVTFFPLSGELVGDVRALVSGRSRDTSGLERIIENISYAGSFGLVSSLFDAVMRDEKSILEFVGGPTVSDVAKVGEGVGDAITGKPEKLAKQLVGMNPVGQIIKPRLFPSNKNKDKGPKEL